MHVGGCSKTRALYIAKKKKKKRSQPAELSINMNTPLPSPDIATLAAEQKAQLHEHNTAKHTHTHKTKTSTLWIDHSPPSETYLACLAAVIPDDEHASGLLPPILLLFHHHPHHLPVTRTGTTGWRRNARGRARGGRLGSVPKVSKRRRYVRCLERLRLQRSSVQHFSHATGGGGGK